MNKDCSDDSDINHQMRSFYIRSTYLVRSFSNCSVEVQRQLFSAYCSSMYCAAVWCNCKKYTIRKLTVAYNNILEDSCFCRYGAVPVEYFVEKPTLSFRNRVLNSKKKLLTSFLRKCSKEQKGHNFDLSTFKKTTFRAIQPNPSYDMLLMSSQRSFMQKRVKVTAVLRRLPPPPPP